MDFTETRSKNLTCLVPFKKKQQCLFLRAKPASITKFLKQSLKAYSGRSIPPYISNLALDRGECLTSGHWLLYPRGKKPSLHSIEGLVDLSAGLDVSKKQKKIYCPYRESKRGLPRPQPSHCTDYIKHGAPKKKIHTLRSNYPAA